MTRRHTKVNTNLDHTRLGIGCVFSAVQALPQGVYTTMDGKIFPNFSLEGFVG